MSFLDRESVVSYRCGCGRYRPLARLYFCRHCYQLRCEFCVSHEIDSRHCPTCLENIPLSEAWLKENRCSNCMLCPMCQCNLTTRIFTSKAKPGETPTPGSDGKAAVSKSYYLCCLFCHWTTRDIGLPDVDTSGNKWPSLENPNKERILELIEFFKAVSTNDRLEQEKKSLGTRRHYSHVTGLSAAVVRQKAGIRVSDALQQNKPEVLRAVADEPSNDLPADIYSKPPDLLKVSNLRQRHLLPEAQPEETHLLRHSRKVLVGKSSYRCRTCEHNVIKPEYAPTSTKFKIHLSAYYVVPEVRIKTVTPLQAGKPSELLLLVINPTQHSTNITFRSYEDELSETTPEMISVPLRESNVKPNALIELPTEIIPLQGRDEIAEFDEPTESPSFSDDPKVVVWRKANKIVVKFVVRPEAGLLAGSSIVTGFTLCHVYTNTSTVIQQDKKQPSKIDHAVKVLLKLGLTGGTE